jgi:hypothetical protein
MDKNIDKLLYIAKVHTAGGATALRRARTSAWTSVLNTRSYDFTF